MEPRDDFIQSIFDSFFFRYFSLPMTLVLFTVLIVCWFATQHLILSVGCGFGAAVLFFLGHTFGVRQITATSHEMLKRAEEDSLLP